MATIGGTSPGGTNPTTAPAVNPAENPVIIQPTYTATPAMMALPADTVSTGDASTTRKFYTITASLRETYDDNVNTTNVNQLSALETDLSPSVLVDFPTPDGDFSARYTFDMTYYSYLSSNNGNNGNNGNNFGNNPTLEYSHEFVAQYTHAFSDRFNLNLAEQFRYFTEPSIYESTGTLYRDGAYISNALNGAFSAQWTPLFGTTTTYANTVVRYDNSAEALEQNSIENTGSQSFSFAIYPEISVSAGTIVDVISYESADRGYENYTGFFGAQWQALPSLSLSGRIGMEYTVPDQGQSSFGPYAALSLNWMLGARSNLSFDYSHEVTPSDQIGTNGQISDRFSANFSYAITPRLSSHLQGIFTEAQVPSSLINSDSNINAYTESDYALDTGLTYQYNGFLNIDTGVTISGVSSDTSFRDYARHQAYVGIRGTY